MPSFGLPGLMIALFRFPILEKTTGIEIRFDPHRTTTYPVSIASHVIRRRFEYQMRVVLGDLKRRVRGVEWGRAVGSASPSWRALYAVSPRRYSATAGSALWLLRISFQL